MICSCFQAPLASRCYSHGKVETDEEFDARWVTYFSKPDIDTWELRKGELDTFFFSINFCFSQILLLKMNFNPKA